MNKIFPLCCLVLAMQVNAANQSQQDEPGFFDSIMDTVSRWLDDEPEKENNAETTKKEEQATPTETALQDALDMAEKKVQEVANSPETEKAVNETKDAASALFGSLKSAAKDVAMQTAGQMATDQIQKSTAEWRDQLNALIEDKSCDTQQHCKVVGVGHLPCGGPSIYMVYSVKNASGKQVETVANVISEQERKLHKELGTMGICKATPQIQAQCVNNQCVEVGSGPNVY